MPRDVDGEDYDGGDGTGRVESRAAHATSDAARRREGSHPRREENA